SIARVLDGGTTDEGLPYLVMEYVDGRALPDYARDEQLDLRGRLRLFAQVCEAVQYAHERQVIHRDLKPGNILVDRPGRVRLLDFGIATLAGAGDHGITVTSGGSALMTPRYASPEQLRGEAATAATDIFSLGIILDELLEDCPGVTSDLQRIVHGATARQAGDRFGSVREMAAEIDRCLDTQPVAERAWRAA